jgi:hypothetical protein
MAKSPRRSLLEQQATLWTSAYPRLASRIAKAVDLVPRIQVDEKRPTSQFHVPGSEGVYTVEVSEDGKTSTCGCVDSSKGNLCKHRIAVALVLATI